MRNTKKMENEVSKKKMEKVKAKEGHEVLSGNCYSEKSAMFFNKDRIDSNFFFLIKFCPQDITLKCVTSACGRVHLLGVAPKQQVFEF